MLNAIRDYFAKNIGPPETGEGDRDHAVRLATAALLVEMTRADFSVREAERAAATEAVRGLFGLPAEETDELMALAQREADEASDLYQFTRLIDQHFPREEKGRIVEMLWRVAFADRHKDAHEEHLVRKIADLLHVPHRDFIRARIKVEEDLGRA